MDVEPLLSMVIGDDYSVKFIESNLFYAVNVLPLLWAHVAIPPMCTFLSYSDDFETLDPTLQDIFKFVYAHLSPRLSEKSIKQMAYTRKFNDGSGESNNDFFNSNRITYMFLHRDYQHLMGNLMSCYLYGYSVFQSFEGGISSVYLIFFSGGIFSTYETFLYGWEDGKITRSLEKPIDDFNVSTVLGTLANYVMTQIPRSYIGSSSGCYALLGASLAVLLRKLTKAYQSARERASGTNSTLTSTTTSTQRDKNEIPDIMYSTLMIANRMLNEYR